MSAFEMQADDFDEACALVRQAFASMATDDGIDPLVILVAAHSEIVTSMCLMMGGAVTAETLLRAAERVRGLPSAAESPLVAMRPAGSA